MLLFSSSDEFETGIFIALNYGHPVHTDTLMIMMMNLYSAKMAPQCPYYGLQDPTTRTATRTSKKTIGLRSKTTISHVDHTFLYISFPFLHDYVVTMPYFAFYGGRKQETTKFYFIF